MFFVENKMTGLCYPLVLLQKKSTELRGGSLKIKVKKKNLSEWREAQIIFNDRLQAGAVCGARGLGGARVDSTSSTLLRERLSVAQAPSSELLL